MTATHGARPIAMVAVAAMVLHLGLVFAYVAAPRFGGDPAVLLCVARARLASEPFRHVRTGFPTDGYDGQFYYVLAQAPFQRHPHEHIDAPAYRHVRILYPLLAWLITGGHPVRLLWAMPAINVLAAGLIAGLGAFLASRRNRSPWWGLLLPLAVNIGAPMLRNLTDPISTCTVVLLITAWIQRWPTWALGCCGILAAFAREQNIAVVMMFGLVAGLQRDRPRFLASLIVVAIWSLWAALLWRAYEESPFVVGNFGPPLTAMLRRLTDPVPSRMVRWTHLYGLWAIGLPMLACLSVVPWLRPERTTMLLGLGGTAMAVLGSWSIWVDPHAYLRVFPWIPLAVWLAALESGTRWPFLLTIALVPWPMVVVFQAWR